MKLFWIAAPALALGAYILARALLRRPLSRSITSALTALLLLAYVLATAALGLFWVARMDLPAFDLHYLFGYCTLLLLSVHLAFQLRPLAVTLRRAGPRWLSTHDGHRFAPSAKLALGLLLSALIAIPAVAYLAGRYSNRRSEIVVAPSPSPSGAASAARNEIWIMRSGTKTSAIDWLYDESRLTRTATLAPVVVVEEPEEVKSPEGTGRALPAAPSRASATLADVATAGASKAEKTGAAAEGSIAIEPPKAAGPDLNQLATLLHYAAGVTSRKAETGGLLLRAAASAGALYPIDVYATASALGEGVHYYHPHEHALYKVAPSGDAIRKALSAKSPIRNASLLFVLGATFDRTGFKYAQRAYRYVLLDAGHIAQNLWLTARALGLSCALEPYFDDEALLSAVAGDEKQEGTLLVLGCSPGALAGDPTLRPHHEPIDLPESTAGRETARMSHGLTSWKLLEGATASSSKRSPAGSKSGVALPKGEAPPGDLFAVIAKRRSVRQMTSEKLALTTLSEVLREAWTGASRLREADLVELHVLAHRVSGLAPGSYRYDAKTHSLVARQTEAFDVQRAGLDQEALGLSAAVLVWTYGSDLGKLAGPRDFRVGAMQAGLGGQAVYLSATARSLGVCGMGAFYDAEVAPAVGKGSRPLYLVALGPR